MEIGIILFIMALNFGISWLNAWSAGMVWAEARALGGWIRVMAWMAAIMSAIGFSSVFLPVLVLGAVALMGNPPEAKQMIEFAFSLWYVLVIFPVLSIGLVAMIQSWIQAYREPSLLNTGVAAWNTYAQIHNTASAINHLGPATNIAAEGIGKLFSGSDGDDIPARLLLLGAFLVACSMVLGVLLTASIIKKYEGTLPMPEQPVRARA
ncbi:MAG: hypothetical protein EBQ80_01095 [Proteobacteria bacterium]|nr:hypothetical protein [Pseudomonadota bacterium]